MPLIPENSSLPSERLRLQVAALPEDKRPTARNLLRAIDKLNAAYPEGLLLEEDGEEGNLPSESKLRSIQTPEGQKE